MAEEKKEKLHIFSTGRTDITMLFVVLFLMVFGIIMVYSSSYYHSLETFGTNSYFFVRQGIWVIVGCGVMYLFSRINHKIFLRTSGILYLMVIGLLITVLIVGTEINGAKRWLDLGPVGFQPSEVAKLGLILTMASLLAGFEKHLDNIKVAVLLVVIAAIPIGLVGKENLSTALILMVVVSGMFFIIYPKTWKLLLIIIPPGAIAIYVLLFQEGYRSARIQAWREGPFADPTGRGFQTLQSLYAIGSGGWFGKGLGRSIQKLEFIPEAHNDIIFSIVCEELGLFGAFSVLMLFAILLWRLFDVMRQSLDSESLLIVVGVMIHIGTQVFINIGVVTNAIPATGIPLPLVSYGGSSMLFLLVEIGIVLNIARCNNRRLEGRGTDA